jgi:ABC-2 type transport system ATP-binding protein
VILIHQGKLLYDGELQGLADRLAPFKLVNLTLGNGTENGIPEINLPEGAEVIHKENGRMTIRVNRKKTPTVTAKLLNELPVADLSIENPPIEAVIDQIYQEGDL